MSKDRGWIVMLTGLCAILMTGAAASAISVQLDLAGNAGAGLLPGNEVGPGTPVGMGETSPATGGEVGDGFVYDTETNVLEFHFEFSGLTGGLFDAASGIHFHTGSPGADPFNETGGITFNLNSGADPNVTLDTTPIAIGATSGTVQGSAILNDAQEADLLAGNIYLNIHSDEYNAGELRGNLVPEPAALALLGLGSLALVRRRRTV